MPLHKGKSEKVFKENVREMVASGHPVKVALAAAYHEKGETGYKSHMGKHHSKVEEVYNPNHADGHKGKKK